MKKSKFKPKVVSPAAVEEAGSQDIGSVYVNFDRIAGGLAIASRNRQYELLVDGTVVALGEIAESRLDVGRVNRISNSNLDDLLPPWRTAEGLVGRNFSVEWTLEHGNTAYLASHAGPGEQAVSAVFACPIEGEALSVLAGETYCFQAYVGLHRTRATLRMTFLDAAGNECGQRQFHSETQRLGGRQLSDYELVHIAAKAPPGTTHARLEIIKGQTISGTDSFLFFTKPAFCHAEGPQDHDGLLNELAFDMVARYFAASPGSFYYDEVPLPDEALDGGWHEITLRDPATGDSQTIPVSLPETVRASVVVKALEGGTLICAYTAPESWRTPLVFTLWVDGAPTTGRHSSPTASGDLRIPIPVSACDGRPHIFDLRLGLSGQILARHAAMGPTSITPWDALQRYAGQPLPAHLSPLAAYRYRSLAAGRGPSVAGGASMRELHDILLEGFEKRRTSFRVLSFPVVASPEVSVVIPAHNRFDVTYACLASLLFAATSISFEVIVVDDGSSDTTRDISAIAPGVVCVRNDKALGFIGACNAGAARARGRHIVFLNNDTEPTAWWLDELLFVFRNNERVGLAGARLVYPDGRLQEAGGIVWETGDPWNYGRGMNPYEPRFSYTRQCDYVSGAAIMIDAALWNAIGGFSAEFMPAYFEDTDLAFKVRAAGRAVVYVPLSVVVHHEGQSNGTEENSESGLKRYQEINRPKFKRKWAQDFDGGGKVGADPDRAKDRGIRKRVLFIDYEVPQLDRDAGSYAAVQEIRMFQALGAKVTFLPINMAYIGRHTDNLQRMGVETIYLPFATGFTRFIAERGSEFDVIYITRYGVAEHVLDAIAHHARQARLVINVADLHFLRQIRDAMHANDRDRMAAALRTRDAEVAVLSRAELILSYSTVEQAVITSHVTNGPKAAIVPWVVDPVPLAKGFAARSGIAFIGGYRHYPNVDAVKFFATEVMPLLRTRLPGVPFLVYGSHATPEIEALATTDIEIRGFVADVSDIFASARLMVAPLLTGAGMKGKVLDYIAHGLPSVLSPVAAEGIGLRDGGEALLAQTPEQWADAIVSLYTDETRWTSMSTAAHEFAARQYNFERGVRGLSEALSLIDLHMTPGTPAFHVKVARPVAPGGPHPGAAEGHYVPARRDG